MRFAEAEADAERALQLEAPLLNPKTLLRRATARQGLQKFRAARSDYNQVRPWNRPSCRCSRINWEFKLGYTASRVSATIQSLRILPQVLALQPNNRQALDELRALRDIPDELDADLAPRSPDLQELLNM